MKDIQRKKEYDKEYSAKNPMKRRKIGLDYYYRHHELVKEKNRKWASKGREFIRQQKLKRGHCVMCDLECTDDTWMMFDFDHVDQEKKFRAISQMHSYSEERILEELENCQLLCSNCHRFITHWESHRQFRKIGIGENKIDEQKFQLTLDL